MHIRACVSTDAGSESSVCTDAAVLKVASSARYGRIAFAVLCDGLKGADGAGKTSAIVAERMAEWFQDELPEILQDAELQVMEERRELNSARLLTEVLKVGDTDSRYMRRTFEQAREDIRFRLLELADDLNMRITGYGRLHRMRMGAAMSCLLLMGGEYLLMRIGTTRAYLANKEGHVRQPATGKEETAAFGTSEHIRPVFAEGTIGAGAKMLLCSDGFIRRQDPERLQKLFRKCARYSERRMEGTLQKLTRLVRRKGEREDAFAVLLALGR